MQLKNQRILLALRVIPAQLCVVSVALAGPWDDQRGGCLTAFGKPETADQKQLVQCADAFGTSARVDRMSGAERMSIERGLRWLYDHGDDLGSHLARESLLRLDVHVAAREPRVANTATQATGTGEYLRYDPPEVHAVDRDAAAKIVVESTPLLKKKKWREGQSKLRLGLDKDPRSESALYNLACAEANLPDAHPDALRHLHWLADLGTDDAIARLVKARMDADFDPIRDTPQFKQITGAVRVLVVNTLGSAGEPAVENIHKLLVQLDQRKPDHKDDDRAPLDHPQIAFLPHAKAQTWLLADLLNHPHVELQPLAADAPSKYDVVIRWGAKVGVVEGKNQPDSPGPDTMDEQIQAARRKQNKVLAQPEQAIAKVNRVVSTPERTYTEAANMGKRVGATVDKAQGSVEKVKTLGEKLNKL